MAVISEARSLVSDDSRLVPAGRCFFTVVFFAISAIYISIDINIAIISLVKIVAHRHRLNYTIYTINNKLYLYTTKA